MFLVSLLQHFSIAGLTTCVVQTLKLIGRLTWFTSKCFLEENTTTLELQDPLDRWCKYSCIQNAELISRCPDIRQATYDYTNFYTK